MGRVIPFRVWMNGTENERNGKWTEWKFGRNRNGKWFVGMCAGCVSLGSATTWNRRYLRVNAEKMIESLTSTRASSTVSHSSTSPTRRDPSRIKQSRYKSINLHQIALGSIFIAATDQRCQEHGSTYSDVVFNRNFSSVVCWPTKISLIHFS